ncbi:hypothetical protein CR513_05975, partial [Mucuna pruriens]
MQKIPYASVVGILMYAQVYTCPDISFVVGVLGRYPGMQYWKRTKGYTFIDSLKVWRSSSTLTPILQDVKIIKYMLHVWIHLYVGWRSYLLETLIAPLTHACKVCGLLRGIQPWDMIVKLYHKFTERIQNKQNLVEYIGKSFMLVYPSIKELIPKIFHEHTAHMSVIP